MNRIRTILLSTILAYGGAALSAAETHTAESPDGNLKLTVTYTDEGSLQYSVTRGSRDLIKSSGLGLSVTAFDLCTFPNGVEWEESYVDETYRMPHGKVSMAHNHYNELAVTGKNTLPGRNLTVRFRVFDDGVAFRYELGSVPGSLTADNTEININQFTRCWAQEYDEGYSAYYPARSWAALSNNGGYCGAMLVQSGTQYLLLSEADVSRMAGSRLYPGETNGSVRYVLEGNTSLKPGFKTAWRTIMMGTLSDIVESTMIQNLMPDTEMSGWEEWVKPGICSWDWGAEDGNSYVTLDRCKKYIDLAEYMGWPYFLLDDGWEGRVNLKEVTDYAASKNVGVLVWSHQGRFNNSYDYNYGILKDWADQGAKGVKIDFFQGDAQNVIEKYQVLLQACADAKLMVNFHGCNKPSGLERQWPHLMTTEANYGGEMYMNWGHLTPADHGVTLALARNPLGPMDYTPVKYGKRDGCAIANTTWAYQTALTVLFESAFLTTCDCPSNLLGRESTPLLRIVPTTWDEIKCLEASTENYITIARRSDRDWWVAGISKNSRNANIDLSFLTPGLTYHAYIYKRGVHNTDISFEKREVTSETKLPISVRQEDGFVMCISLHNDYPYPSTIRREAENYVQGVGTQDDSKWCSQGKKAAVMNKSSQAILFNDIEVEDEGEYILTLFYTNDNQSTSAISINGGEEEYHTFNRAGGEASHDPLGFTSIIINLNKGNNTIKISPRGNSNTPAFDRILLMKERMDEALEIPEIPGDDENKDDSGVSMISSVVPELNFANGTIRINLLEKGTLTLFGIDGEIIGTYSVEPGENIIESNAKGLIIANIRCGSLSISKKVIL